MICLLLVLMCCVVVCCWFVLCWFVAFELWRVCYGMLWFGCGVVLCVDWMCDVLVCVVI